ncbi:F-box protein SKIP8-like protein isoform X1 [Tanacetum coccineum]
MAVTAARMMNGGGGDGGHVAVVGDREIGASMMEQLVPEITTHALSYLDYPSLCRLSMTNSSMRRAANDDNAWKALYHKLSLGLLLHSLALFRCQSTDSRLKAFEIDVRLRKLLQGKK